MSRLQILELPTEHHGDDMITPWVLVIDEAETGPDEGLLMKPSDWEGVRAQLGARAVLVFEETVEIPANQLT
jgi:hypothetical protein